MNQPAGWFPQVDGQQRYWDGDQWTEHFAPGGAPAAAAPPGAVIAADKPARPWFKKKRFMLPGGALAIILIATAFNRGGTSPTVAANVPIAAPSVAQTSAGAPKTAAPKAVAPAAPNGDAQVTHYNETYGTFTGILKSGRGDATIALPQGAKAGLVIATHNGSANFQVSGLDKGNQPTIDGLVNAIGNYSGTTAYGLTDMGNPPVKLQVTADGTWTITIAPLSSARVLPAATSGKGDEVFRYDGDAVDYAITHKGQANFQVQQYGGDPNMGVNEIGNYSGIVPFVAGPTVLVIVADGTWTFKKQG